MNKATVTSRIPAFATREEEAAFWDTHDTTDFEDEMVPVKVKVTKHLSAGVTVRLDSRTVARLSDLAATKGLGPSTLMRMWILERLQAETAKLSLGGV